MSNGLVPETGFIHGASGPAESYNTTPTGLGLSPAYLAASSASATAQAVGGGSGSEYTYNEFSAPVTVSASTEATADIVVSASTITSLGDRTLIVFFCPYFTNPAVATASLTLVLYDGSSSLGILSRYQSPTATPLFCGPLYTQRLLTPSAGAHDYSIRAFAGGGNFTLQANVGGVGVIVPGSIRITRA